MIITITKVSKTLEWAKNIMELTDKEIAKEIKSGYTYLYVYSVYPRGGGDDRIEAQFFNKEIPVDILPKFFSNSKIKGQLYGPICEIKIN